MDDIQLALQLDTWDRSAELLQMLTLENNPAITARYQEVMYEQVNWEKLANYRLLEKQLITKKGAKIYELLTQQKNNTIYQRGDRYFQATQEKAQLGDYILGNYLFINRGPDRNQFYIKKFEEPGETAIYQVKEIKNLPLYQQLTNQYYITKVEEELKAIKPKER